MASSLLRAIDSSVVIHNEQDSIQRLSPHPSPVHPPANKHNNNNKSSLEPYFIKPMNLCEPDEDLMGYTHVCSLRLQELPDMKYSKLNTPLKIGGGRLVPSFIVRLWSRASGRYLHILPVGGMPYARGSFGAMGHFRMLVVDEEQALVIFRSCTQPQLHLAVRRNSITGHGLGDEDSVFKLSQNADGYMIVQWAANSLQLLGIRHNGNIMPTNQVDATSVNAQFIVQKEAMDII